MIAFSLALEVLLLLSCSNLAVGDTFHIVTSQSSSCPGEFSGVPCLTLQQYVSNPSIDTSTTLLFQTGNHSLDTTFSATSAILFSMTGSNVTIECTSSLSQITFSLIQEVYISGVTFMRCNRGISFTNIETLTLNASAVQQSNTYSAREVQ